MPPRPRTRFDPARANRAQTFFERFLVHTKGRYAGQPFKLARWQRADIIRPLFGTVRYDRQLREWIRAYTLAWIELAKKNGKSEMAAGIALLLLCADDEEEAEVYGCAKDKDQAAIVYQVAARMVELSPRLSKRLTVIDSKRRIVDARTGSFYQVVAADGSGNYGVNQHGVIFDEVITQPSRELWDAFKSGLGSTRSQPLMMALTTAGDDPTSFAAEEHLLCEQVAADPDLDPTRFVYMRNTPTDVDWRDEANWYYANPALGDFKRVQAMRDEAHAAEQSLARQKAYRQFHLNQWQRQTVRWLDIDLWDACGEHLVDELALKGRTCYAGMDLASTADFAGYCLVFPPVDEDEPVRALWRFFLPSAAVAKRSGMRPLLEEWAADGWLEVTPGRVIDYGAIEDRFDRDAAVFRIADVGYDRWNADQTVRRLEEAGQQVQGIPQTTTKLNAPSKHLEHLLGERRPARVDGTTTMFAHGGNPIARWMADSVTVWFDRTGLMKPDKKSSKEKIDGIVMLVMALYCWDLFEDVQDFAFVV